MANIGSGDGLFPDAVIWTNVNELSVRSCDIHVRAISREILKLSIRYISIKITNLILHHLHIPGANENWE